MRRFLPLLLVAVLAIIAWAVLYDGNNEQPLDTDWQDPELNQIDDSEATPADSGASRIGEAVAAPAEFTNRPVKKGVGRHGLHGIVVDENGEPVEQAWVAAYSSPFPIADFIESPAEILEKPLELKLDPLASTFTDKDGRFQLGGVPGRSVYLTARKKMRLSHGRQRVSATDLDQENGVTIKTFAAAALSGTVIDEKGSPVANAEVLVNPGLKFLISAVRNREIFLERTFTDAAGNFEVEAVPTGMVLAVSAFDGATHPGIADFGPAARNTTAKVRVQLSDVGDLSGQVLDTEDKPVRNANVAAIPLDLRMVVPVLRDVPAWVASSDGGGNYSFPRLPQGQYLLVAQSNEGRSGPVSTHIVGENGSVQNVVIDTQNEVSGRVLDTKGDPIPNAVVSLMSVPEGEAVSQAARRNSMNFLLEMAREALPEILPADTTATTDSKGRFQLAAWRQARVRVEANGFVTGDFRFGNIPEKKQPVLVMMRPGAVEGKVVTGSDDDLDPISYYILQCDRRSSGLRGADEAEVAEVDAVFLAPVQTEDSAPNAQGETKKRQIGSDELQAALAEDEYVLEPAMQQLAEFKNSQFVDDPKGRFKAVGLMPGKYRLKVRAEGFETGRETVSVTEGEITKDVVIKMGGGATVTGLVLDKNTSLPVSGAMVTMDRQKEGGFTLLAQGFTEGNQMTMTRDDGSFELRGVEEGARFAHVMASGYSMHTTPMEAIQEGELRGPLKLELMPGGNITGKVTDRHDVPLPQRMVVAFSPGSTDFQQAGTDEGGVYLIENLRPGNYMLISASLDDESLFTGDMMSILSGGKFVPATVTEGETTTQDIIDPSAGGCRLSGTLTKAGAPVANAALTAMSMGGAGFLDFRMASARTDESGNFVFKSLAPGEYSVNVESQDWRGSLDLFVDDLPEDWVGLRVPESVVTGSVVSSTTKMPLEGVNVRMVREDSPGGISAMFGGGGGGGRRSASTDSNGQFRIEGAPPGDYHLVVEPEGRSWRRRDQGEQVETSYRKLESRSFFLDEDEVREMSTMELVEAGRVNVTVFNEAGEKFEKGFRLRAVPANGGEMPKDLGDLSGWGWDGKGEIQGIPAGSWDVQIEARGFAMETKTASVAAGQNAELEFRMKTGVQMRVRIIGKDGKPAPSAAVTVLDSNGKRLKSEGGGSGGGAMMQRFFSGGSDGTRTLGSFAEGPYTLQVSLDDSTTEHQVNLASGGDVIEVRL
jgi:protocatechuate 3,4-dioxygenase beta subunit